MDLDKLIESIEHKSNSRLNTADIDAINTSGGPSLQSNSIRQDDSSHNLDDLTINAVGLKTSLLTQMHINKKSRKHYLPQELGLKPLYVSESQDNNDYAKYTPKFGKTNAHTSTKNDQ